MFTIKECKTEARKIFKENRKLSVVSMLMAFAGILITSSISFIYLMSCIKDVANGFYNRSTFIMLYVIFLIPFFLFLMTSFPSLFMFYSGIKKGFVSKFEDLYKFVKVKSIGMCMYICLRLFAWNLLVIVPYLAVVILSIILKKNEIKWLFALKFVFKAMIACVYVLLIKKSVAYSFSFFVYCEDADKKISESFKEGYALSVGYKMKFFLAWMSFIGWGFLCIITLGVLSLYVFPYEYYTFVNFYDCVKAEKAVKMTA